jgi:RES domain-containing protein
LPKDWNSIPFLSSTQLIGDQFLKKNNALVLKVPSVVISDEFNYLINPQHPDFKKIKIIEKNRFVFDPRL